MTRVARFLSHISEVLRKLNLDIFWCKIALVTDLSPYNFVNNAKTRADVNPFSSVYIPLK